MASSKELGIGVIGLGNRSGLAMHANRPKEGCRVIAGCDNYPGAIEKFRGRHGEMFYTQDYHELLARKDVGAVFITSPDYLHEEMAVAALEAGKAVYLEKPMAITIEGCDRILQTAYRTTGKLYLGHNMRHMSFVQKMKELIEGGAIGEVKTAWCRHFVAYGGDAYFKDWHSERRYAMSLLLQKAAHDIDVLHWLCGGYSTRVNGMGKLAVYDKVKDRRPADSRGDAGWSEAYWPPLSQKQLSPIIDVEDISMMQMELDNGVLASYQQCHFAPDAWRNYTVIGTHGRIENFNDNPGNCVIRLWDRRTGYNPYGDKQFFIPPEEGGHGGADPNIVNEFLKFVREDVKVTTSPIAARYAVAAGCLAATSIRSGNNAYNVPPVDEKVLEYFAAQVK